MITLKQALEIAKKDNPTMKIDTVLEVKDCWVFSFVDKESNESPDISPTYVNKSNGSTGEYFPPDHIEELETAVEIDLIELQKD